jgi:hypothetical protein
MLLLSAPKTITVDDVTVFPDHADPNQFWYLPGPVSLAKRTDGQAVFTFIKYKPAAVESGVKGGGFVMFATQLKLDSATQNRILSRLSAIAPGTPNLSLVPFDTGTVKCVALNLEGEGGTEAKSARAGAFNAVESILGATTPSLQGDEEAAFSLTLSQEGAIILEQAYKQGTGPIGVVYDLKFTGLRPSLDVRITADFKRIYDGLSASLSGQYYFVKASLEAAFEKLKQDGAIKVEVTNFASDQDAKDKEKWALDFFTEKLLTDWFDPTLSLGQPKVTTTDSEGDPLSKAAAALGNATGGRGTDSHSSNTSQNPGSNRPSSPGEKTDTGNPPAGGHTGDAASAGKDPAASGSAGRGKGASAATDAGSGKDSSGGASKNASANTAGKTGSGTATATAPAPAHQPARLEIVSHQPDPLPDGYNIQRAPSASGLTETITISGGVSAPTVTVDGTPRTLNASRQLTLDVNPGDPPHTIAAEWPPGARPFETFNLDFQYDLPAQNGFNTQPPSASYRSYLTNTAADQPFRRSHADNGTSSSRGAQALRDWIATLADPKTVELDAHASWEGHPESDTATTQHNLALSNRRLQVALGIIGNSAHTSFANGSGFTGDQEARAAGRRSAPGGTADNPDRVVHVKGYTGPATSAVSIGARISRPQDVAPPQNPDNPPTPTPTKPPDTPQTTPDKPQDKPPAAGSGDGQIAGSPAIAFKLKFVHQEELKTMVFEYHRSDATQRTYAPQGFFGLMLSDLDDDQKHFVEVDLDDVFFREFAVSVQAPINFQKIGLQSTHVSLDYGNHEDEANHKHGDMIFDASRAKEQKFAVFMNASHDTSYTYATEYHFDPDSGWDGRSFAYQFPPKSTEDRNLFLNPYDQIGFLEVQVFPHQIDAGVIDSIDVDLAHTDPGGEIVRRTLNVTPGSQPQFWRVRLDDPKARTYTYQLTHHLKDGTVRTADPVTTQATALPVNDPFEQAIEIDFVPLMNATKTRTVFIDIHYDDPKNNYHRQERLTLQGNAQNNLHVRIALLNPAITNYRYRLTFVGTNNQMTQGAFVETTETLIAVTDAP